MQSYERTVLELVDRIYEAPASGDWRPALEGMRDALDLVASALAVADLRQLLPQLNQFVGIDPEIVGVYNRDYPNEEPLRPLGRMPVGSWLSTEMLFEPRRFRRTDFHGALLQPTGIDQTAAYSLVKDETAVAVVSFHRASSREPFGERDRRFVDHLAPHLRRAIELHRRLLEVEARAESLAAVLDRIAVGAALFDEQGRLVVANRAAREIAADGDGFELMPEGVRALASSDTQAMREAVRQAIGTTRGEGITAGGALRLPRASGRRPYEVLVSPLPCDRIDLGGGTACAVLFVSDPERTPHPEAERLRVLYGFTPAESRLAQELMTGASLSEIAEDHGVSLHTVRTQLKQLLAKTDTRRQSELMRLLYRSIARVEG